MEYKCEDCGMGVTGLRCSKCNSELVHDQIEVNDETVGVSKCPNGCGMIKSPQCCGKDMQHHG